MGKINDDKSKNYYFFIDKKQIYIDNKRTQEYTGREQKGTKTPITKKTRKPPENYLLPIQVRKSITECV